MFFISSICGILLLVLGFSGCATSLVGSAKIYEERGDYNMAVRYYERAADLELQKINKMPIYIQLSRLYARVGRLDVAQARFEDALAIASGAPEEAVRGILPEIDAEYCLALDALEKDNCKRCISLLEDILSANDAADIHYYLSIAYKRQSEKYLHDEVIVYVEELTTSSPVFRDSISHIDQGRSMSQLGLLREAQAKFRLALEHVDENATPSNAYENALLLTKRKEYMEAAHTLLEMNETADVRYYLGFIYQELARVSAGKSAQALEVMGKDTFSTRQGEESQ